MGAHPVYSFYRFLWTGLDWIFPPRCGGCDQVGKRWCIDCQGTVRAIQPPLCAHCGAPAAHVGICSSCREKPPAYAAARSWGTFEGPLQNAIHRLKYRRDLGLGEALSRPMVGRLHRVGWKVDLVLPMPLGTRRREQRGYNQAALLALPLALGAGVPYRPEILRRIRETRSQVGLSPVERRENVRGAFGGVPRAAVSGRTVLLVDDVLTTGATIDAAAHALVVGGAKRVFALTLARALPSGR